MHHQYQHSQIELFNKGTTFPKILQKNGINTSQLTISTRKQIHNLENKNKENHPIFLKFCNHIRSIIPPSSDPLLPIGLWIEKLIKKAKEVKKHCYEICHKVLNATT